MKYELPKLNFGFNALEPYMDEKTVSLHYGKHHQTYVDKLNNAIADFGDFDGVDIDTVLRNAEGIPEKIKTQVINNGGGHSNHTIFWSNLSPEGGGEPFGEISDAIKKKFNNFIDFKEEFEGEALKFFGSGWVWLVFKEGKMEIMTTANQDSPLSKKYEPLLALDLWEHSYYLKYQNRRVDYISAWWNIVDWNNVEQRYLQAKN